MSTNSPLEPLPAGQPDATRARAARRAARFTQAEVAAAAGLDRAIVSRVENGVLKPSERQRYKLAAALGLKPYDLTKAPEASA